MTFSEMKLAAKNNLRGNFGTALLASVLLTVITAVGNLIPVVGSLLVIGPLQVGHQKIYRDISKEHSSDISDLFYGFKTCFGESFLMGLLVAIFTVLWSFLFVIPGIIKAFSYSMTYYIAVREPGVSATEAITLSRSYMKGHKMELFLFQLSFIGWYLLCMITFGIALIYVVPYVSEAQTVFFDQIYAERNGTTNEYSYASEDAYI